MEKHEAIEAISVGHGIYSVESAREVCLTLGVPFSEKLVKVWESDKDPLGVTMYRGPEDGVWSLDLAHHIARELGVADQAVTFIDRGPQAREYARVISAKLGIAQEV